jgi:hypothetical protein
MNKLITSLVASFVLATLALADSGTCTPCDDSDWTVERGWAVFGDVLLVRPLGTAGTIAGFGVFAIASPFAAMADATEDVFDTLVKQPADYTFNRDLGVFTK